MRAKSIVAHRSTPPRFLLDTASAHGAPPPTSSPPQPTFRRRCADQVAGLKVITHDGRPLPGGDSLVRFARSLAGAAGMFSFAEVSARDSVLETRLVGQADGASVRVALEMTMSRSSPSRPFVKPPSPEGFHNQTDLFWVHFLAESLNPAESCLGVGQFDPQVLHFCNHKFQQPLLETRRVLTWGF